MNGSMTRFLKSGYGTWYDFYNLVFGSALLDLVFTYWRIVFQSFFFGVTVWILQGYYNGILYVAIDKLNL